MNGDFGLGLQNATRVGIDVDLDPLADADQFHFPNEELFDFLEFRFEDGSADARHGRLDSLFNRNGATVDHRHCALSVFHSLMTGFHGGTHDGTSEVSFASLVNSTRKIHSRRLAHHKSLQDKGSCPHPGCLNRRHEDSTERKTSLSPKP